jgi:LysM repeat protein
MVLGACDAILTPPATAVPTLRPTAARGLATPTIAPEIYLTPIPPTPTFTPSPTPTPVIHIVASGDTLLGIALDYGVTVDALVRTNALDASAFLRIGQALIIPLEEGEEIAEDALQVPEGNVLLPTPTPVPVTTAGVALYRTPVGGLWCMGEVLNTTGGAITNLQVEIVLLGPDGTPLATARALAAADILQPQARAPFSVLFRNPPDGTSDVEVRLLRAEAISPITAGFVSLTVSESEGDVSGPQFRVRGTLVNDSGQAISRVIVVATLYSAGGDVVGYRQLVMGDGVVLAPGEELPFELLLTPQGVERPSGFSVIAWGISS